uniref:Extracellular solute-binding protein n=2 Tax=Paracidobacterium acidisoli TaxID=2303751 RepID=A0A372IST7_9BACT
MLATAQRFEEMHAGLSITWETRSLQSFADEPLEVLAERYDLMVIDHPSCGRAASGGFLRPLDEVMAAAVLEDQAKHSVGESYASYVYEGHVWALPIDAATPVSLRRTDLLERAGEAAPHTWEELMGLARKGLVAAAGLAIDSLMHFFMLCQALGEEPFTTDGRVASDAVGREAMRRLRELLLLCPKGCLHANPIAIWNVLSTSDSAAYCPFAYGYSNYSRRAYAEHVVEAGELVTLDGTVLRSTLGGAGLAISARCSDVATAAAYAQYVASERCQKTLYFDAGGQPGHRAAWLDAEVNRRSNGFFEKTLPVLDRAWVRPRFDGYLTFQSRAGERLHAYLREGGAEGPVMEAMNEMLQEAHRGGAR